MENVSTVINPLLPERFKGLTDDKQICETSCGIPECIDDFRWRAEPIWPEEFVAFKRLGIQEKEKYLEHNEKFFREGAVPAYLDQRDLIRNKNERNFNQLKEWFKLEVSEGSRRLLEKMLNTYSGRMK